MSEVSLKGPGVHTSVRQNTIAARASALNRQFLGQFHPTTFDQDLSKG
jgi:hypothetical protein